MVPKLSCACYWWAETWAYMTSTSSHQPLSNTKSTSSCYTTALGFLNRAKILRDMLCSCRLHARDSLHDRRVTFTHLKTPACGRETSADLKNCNTVWWINNDIINTNWHRLQKKKSIHAMLMPTNANQCKTRQLAMSYHVATLICMPPHAGFRRKQHLEQKSKYFNSQELGFGGKIWTNYTLRIDILWNLFRFFYVHLQSVSIFYFNVQLF